MSNNEISPFLKYPGWNTRYIHYAVSKGESPESQMALDKINWPGGSMTGFILWIQEMGKSFADEKDYIYDGVINIHQEEFDKWLLEKFPIQ